ncbi:MAG: T9SS type A sorting domain-containing protein [Bacteroidetes bacterium]|nr:T9SS type A sorting domain-containing protein [Bacteroidota bacterium]
MPILKTFIHHNCNSVRNSYLKRFYLPVLLLIIFSAPRIVSAHGSTWTDSIACIIYNHCSSCHNPKGIAPFSLTTYNEVYANRNSIYESVKANNMPPFPPDESKVAYAHANTLTEHEKEEILTWILGFAPLGDPDKVPDPPVFKDQYEISDPDLIVKLPTYTVNTDDDEYRAFVIPLNNPEEKFIAAYEFVPGNREIVHHAIIFQDTTKVPLQLDQADPDPGYIAFGGTGSDNSTLLGGYTPGQSASIHPAGFGNLLYKQTYLVVQMHYPGGISNAVDSSHIRIKYASGKVREIITVAALEHQNTLLNGPLVIPADSVKTFYNKATTPLTATVLAVLPHMHLLGKSIKAYGITPAKDTIPFVDIPKWDFHWQGFYTFKKPIILPIGTTLRGEATYDNTSDNLDNPNHPPKTVSLGEGTDDEMFLVFFSFAFYQPGDENLVVDPNDHWPHTMCQAVSSVENLNTDNDLLIFPNPATGFINIHSGKSIQSIEVLRADGVSVLQNQNPQPTDFNINISKPGLYWIKIISKDGIQEVRKVVVE